MPNLPSDPHEFIAVCKQHFELLARLAMGQNIKANGQHVSKSKAIAHEATVAAKACEVFITKTQQKGDLT